MICHGFESPFPFFVLCIAFMAHMDQNIYIARQYHSHFSCKYAFSYELTSISDSQIIVAISYTRDDILFNPFISIEWEHQFFFILLDENAILFEFTKYLNKTRFLLFSNVYVFLVQNHTHIRYWFS